MNAKRITRCVLLSAALLLCLSCGAWAEIEWGEVKDIKLDETPLDMVLASDGNTAYILTEKNILLYSVRSGKVTDTVPLKEKYSGIAVAPKGGALMLTSAAGKKVSLISISEVFDIPIGTSPVIGKKDARVTLTAFLDYQ